MRVGVFLPQLVDIFVCWDRRLFFLVPVLLSLSLVIVGTRPPIENLGQDGHKVKEGKLWNEI